MYFVIFKAGDIVSPQNDVIKPEKKEDLLKERPSRKNKKKEKENIEKPSVKPQITKMPLVLPVEASIFALFLIVLLGAFYVVSILPLIFSFFFKFSHRKKTKIPLKIKFTELS